MCQKSRINPAFFTEAATTGLSTIYLGLNAPDLVIHGRVPIRSCSKVDEIGDSWSAHLVNGFMAPFYSGTTIKSCIIESRDPTQFLIHGGTERTDFTVKASIQWCAAVTSDFNTYYHPSSTKAFFSRVLKNNWEDDVPQLTLEQWRTQSGQDLHFQCKPSDLTAIKDPTLK